MQKHKLPYHSISAKTGDNIETLFFSVVDMINQSQMQRMKKLKQKINNDEEESHTGPLTEKPLRAGNNTNIGEQTAQGTEGQTEKDGVKLDKKN